VDRDKRAILSEHDAVIGLKIVDPIVNPYIDLMSLSRGAELVSNDRDRAQRRTVGRYDLLALPGEVAWQQGDATEDMPGVALSILVLLMRSTMSLEPFRVAGNERPEVFDLLGLLYHDFTPKDRWNSSAGSAIQHSFRSA